METVQIYRLPDLPPRMRQRLRDAQIEAARVWNLCRDLHLAARRNHTRWPERDALQTATKGQFALHSQTVQMICHQFVTIVENTKKARSKNPRLRYPYRDNRFHSLYWPAQAVSIEHGRVVLPMGRGRPSLVLHVAVPSNIGACQLVWDAGYELHVSMPLTPPAAAPGPAQATVDLGEVHQAAVTTNTGVALVISGRGIRSLKRLRNKTQGQIARKRSQCQKGSKRWRRLLWASRRQSARLGRQIRDLRHKGTRRVVDFCIQEGVGILYDTGGEFRNTALALNGRAENSGTRCRGSSSKYACSRIRHQCPLCRQPGWRTQAARKPAAPPTDVSMGVWEARPISHISTLYPA
jgi:putative transposase